MKYITRGQALSFLRHYALTTQPSIRVNGLWLCSHCTVRNSWPCHPDNWPSQSRRSNAKLHNCPPAVLLITESRAELNAGLVIDRIVMGEPREMIGDPREQLESSSWLCRWQTGGGGSIPRWSASKTQDGRPAERQRARQKKIHANNWSWSTLLGVAGWSSPFPPAHVNSWMNSPSSWYIQNDGLAQTCVLFCSHAQRDPIRRKRTILVVVIRSWPFWAKPVWECFRTRNWARRRKLFCRWFCFLLGKRVHIGCCLNPVEGSFYYFVLSGGFIVCC